MMLFMGIISCPSTNKLKTPRPVEASNTTHAAGTVQTDENWFRKSGDVGLQILHSLRSWTCKVFNVLIYSKCRGCGLTNFGELLGVKVEGEKRTLNLKALYSKFLSVRSRVRGIPGRAVGMAGDALNAAGSGLVSNPGFILIPGGSGDPKK